MQVLAASDEPLSADALFTETGLSPEEGQESLKTLLQHDVIINNEMGYDFAVPLMRRWLRAHKPSSVNSNQ